MLIITAIDCSPWIRVADSSVDSEPSSLTFDDVEQLSASSMDIATSSTSSDGKPSQKSSVKTIPIKPIDAKDFYNFLIDLAGTIGDVVPKISDTVNSAVGTIGEVLKELVKNLTPKFWYLLWLLKKSW